MLAALILAATAWAWTPVEGAVYYRVLSAPVGQPWVVQGWITELYATDVYLAVTDPPPGGVTCVTIQSVDAYNNDSELAPCCGPCEGGD